MSDTMQLIINVPTHIVIDRAVTKIIAEAENGYFCLLPRHVDFVCALSAGIFRYFSTADESLLVLNRGILVKCGNTVRVSSADAIHCNRLEDLQGLIADKFMHEDEHERQARSALSRLELGTIRHFIELKEQMRG